eukprot:gene1222-1798_t
MDSPRKSLTSLTSSVGNSLTANTIRGIVEDEFQHLYLPPPEEPEPEEAEEEGAEAAEEAPPPEAEPEPEVPEPEKDPDPFGYEARLQEIEEKCGAKMSEMDDLEAYLSEARRKAREAEAIALATADTEFTVKHRNTGLPKKPNPLELDGNTLRTAGLLNPVSLMAENADARWAAQQPPRTMEFLDSEESATGSTGNHDRPESSAMAHYIVLGYSSQHFLDRDAFSTVFDSW